MRLNSVAEIAAAWEQAQSPVVFTGAGMSTESGLPDFRSAQGLWKSRPESLATMTALKTQPDEFYFFYQWRIAKLRDVSPNIGHHSLALLERLGLVTALITQNVDGLHQQAGSVKVTELHGSLRTVSCLNCAAQYESTVLIPQHSAWEEAYKAGLYHYGSECLCPKCNGFLRPDVVLFGEQLPQESWEKAVKACENSDFFVVLGSSLAVAPANVCPQLAVRNGAKLLIVNNDPTPLDELATWVVRASIGDVLAAITGRLEQKKEPPPCF
ncbi:MAG: NAD-dependent deacylase [Negativicutes bacterium]|nr:NAD-dependent deacylase [Negativicutes bacterium]